MAWPDTCILTTLKLEDGFSRDEIIKIYGARWGIETMFKEL
jgi:IS4 transposase